MATPIESGVGFINYGKQTAKGSIATAATTTNGYNRIKHTAGGLKIRKVLSRENYSDGRRVSSPSTFTNEIGGVAGTLTLQAQPENLGLYWAQILGADVVTGSSDPYTHTIVDNNSGGAFGTWWQKVGSAVGPERQAFWDSKIAKIVQNSPRDRNIVHLELDVMALKHGQVFTTDPTKTEDTTDALLLTESSGGFTFDSTTIREVKDSIIEFDTGMEPEFGDSLEPLHLIEGRAAPGISWSLESILTDDTLAKYRKAQYGTATPSAGDRPVKDVFAPALSQVITRSVTRTATFSAPKVEIDPENFEAIAPQVDGGVTPVRFGGACLKSGATPPLTLVVLSAEAASYA